jgi:hypothetical protein
MLFHGLLKFVLVHAFIGIEIVGSGIGTDFKFLEELGFDLLSEKLAVVFGVLKIDSTDELLTLHLTHFLLFVFLLYANGIFFLFIVPYCSFSLKQSQLINSMSYSRKYL